ncbi:hypothetical protein ABZ307_34900 [Streptomyces griseorubiginosus]|uniref:hypothetical protein n=1 Tax=Streptomyces griseorubiginosus TaxID=67304 RepID=UPI0033BAB560
MGTAHVVEVGVGDHENRVVLEKLGRAVSEGCDAQAGIDQEITVCPLKMPDVGAEERCTCGSVSTASPSLTC